jgi:hypothetical protein
MLHHLSQYELATRLRLSARTLERWRWTGQGPRFLKAGNRIAYRIEDVEVWEAARLRTDTGPRDQR